MSQRLPRLGLGTSLILHGAVLLMALPAFKPKTPDIPNPSRSLEITLLAASGAVLPKPQSTLPPPLVKTMAMAPLPSSSPTPSPAAPSKAGSPPETSTPPPIVATEPGPEPRGTAPQMPQPPGEPALMQRYVRLLTERLSQRSDYPPLAALRGWQGLVHIRITLSRQGDLLHAQVANSSGFAVLDQHALQRVRDATPLPAMAGTVSGDPLQLVIPVQYRLERGQG